MNVKIWQLQEAKAKLSELIQIVLKSGPQGISIRGIFEIVVMSKKDYDKLKNKPENLAEFISKSPLKGANIKLSRDKSPIRSIDL